MSFFFQRKQLTENHTDMPWKTDHAILFSAAVVVASLSSLYALFREDRKRVPKSVYYTSILGGALGGVFVAALQIHYYGWEYPWLILATSVPAAYGSPLIIASGVNFISSLLEKLGGSKEDK